MHGGGLLFFHFAKSLLQSKKPTPPDGDAGFCYRGVFPLTNREDEAGFAAIRATEVRTHVA